MLSWQLIYLISLSQYPSPPTHASPLRSLSSHQYVRRGRHQWRRARRDQTVLFLFSSLQQGLTLLSLLFHLFFPLAVIWLPVILYFISLWQPVIFFSGFWVSVWQDRWGTRKSHIQGLNLQELNLESQVQFGAQTVHTSVSPFPFFPSSLLSFSPTSICSPLSLLPSVLSCLGCEGALQKRQKGLAECEFN